MLQHVSLDVNPGEFIALVGQSGSGKSTLLNIMGGLDDPDEGSVTAFGVSFQTAREDEIAALRARRIGFVFQAFQLLDHLTCLGNVLLPSQFTNLSVANAEAAARDALSRVGLSDYAARKPSQLSGGQKQRVAIARALFARPELLLCDEPTGNLDATTGKEILDFFCQLNREGTTLVIVTHEKRVSSLASRVLSMQKGMLVTSSGGEAS